MPDYVHVHAGVPPPALQWYKDAVSVHKLRNPRYQALPAGGLRIQKLRPEDSGIFQCFASNEGGEAQTSTYLDVTSEYCPSPGPGPLGWLPDLCPRDASEKTSVHSTPEMHGRDCSQRWPGGEPPLRPHGAPLPGSPWEALPNPRSREHTQPSPPQAPGPQGLGSPTT